MLVNTDRYMDVLHVLILKVQINWHVGKYRGIPRAFLIQTLINNLLAKHPDLPSGLQRRTNVCYTDKRMRVREWPLRATSCKEVNKIS